MYSYRAVSAGLGGPPGWTVAKMVAARLVAVGRHRRAVLFEQGTHAFHVFARLPFVVLTTAVEPKARAAVSVGGGILQVSGGLAAGLGKAGPRIGDKGGKDFHAPLGPIQQGDLEGAGRTSREAVIHHGGAVERAVGLQLVEQRAQVGVNLGSVVKDQFPRRVLASVLQGDHGVLMFGGRPGPPLVQSLCAPTTAVQRDD